MLETVKRLIKRQVNARADEFIVELLPPKEEDYYQLLSVGDNIVIRGNNEGSIAAGFHWYLKHYCQLHVSWCGSNVTLPRVLPKINETFSQSQRVPYRYYLNYCTFSYSMAYWDFSRWEQEIDLMAMFGLNMPLMVVGHEYVWLKVGKRLGLKTDDILSFLAGPSYLAWHYMGNVDGIGGPLTIDWIKQQHTLSLQIIKRLRAFGMKVVLPGFYGHVPVALKALCQEQALVQLADWFGAEGIWFLEPNSDLFKEVATIFYEEQEKLYGNDHLYALDLFHEGSAPNKEKGYLADVGRLVAKRMLEYDKQAVWVMQSWSMDLEMIEAIPKDHLLILDLNADVEPKWEENNGFNDRRFIWCMLHNFGGRNGMSGDLSGIYEKLRKALKNKETNKLCGIGFTPEAIEENPIFYDLITDMMWDKEVVYNEKWLASYVLRRYQRESKHALSAWDLLMKSVYSGSSSFGPTDSVLCARPDVIISKVTVSSVVPYFKITDLFLAFDYLLKDYDALKSKAGYRYDLIDVGRECLAMSFRPVYLLMMKMYHQKDEAKFNSYAQLFTDLAQTMNTLLSHNVHFLLGPKLTEAMRFGNDPSEKKHYRMNVLMQLTRWWPSVSFVDYAHKHWEGLITDYYLVRWRIFISHLKDDLTHSKTFNKATYLNEIKRAEQHFIESETVFLTEAQPHLLNTCQSISRDFLPKIKTIINNGHVDDEKSRGWSLEGKR